MEENLNSDFIYAVLSGPRGSKRLSGISKVRVRPLLKKGRLLFQLEIFKGNQAFHENLEAAEAAQRLLEHMESMRQMQLETTGACYTVLVSKKGKATIARRVQRAEKGKREVSLSHDRQKKYILEEGIPVPFLQDLGVMTKEGKVVRGRFDKFRQINRFLEFVEDILPALPKGREVRILDFGCGKSYLTFAMYYYLHELNGYDVRITGLDLKSEVIRNCNALGRKYGYEKLHFQEGDIADYAKADGTEEAGDKEKRAGAVDMVVTLHACDTATDFALAKAVEWNAKVILSVPCCQHELNGQIKSDVLKPILGYGLLKERIAALVTDGLRGQYLEREGYAVQVLEFIDMEHTPKNILIRAVYTGKKSDNAEQIAACEEFLHVSPTLQTLLDR